MRARHWLRELFLGFLSGCVILTPAFAVDPAQTTGGGQVEVGSEEGLPNTPPSTPGGDTSTEEEFNPTITCSNELGSDIELLIQCLVNSIPNPPPSCPPEIWAQHGSEAENGILTIVLNGGQYECAAPYDRSDFIVTALPPPFWGVEIVRVDGEPMQRLLFRENTPGIQTTQIRVDNANRIGRIKELDEVPALDGSVFVRVNDTQLELSTSVYQTSVEISAAIVAQLRAAGFLVIYAPPYIVIQDFDTGPNGGIRRVQFRSTDHGIVSSDLAILPPEEAPGNPPPPNPK